MPQLIWTKLDYNDGTYQIVAKDRCFAYMLKHERIGAESSFPTRKTFYFHNLKLYGKKLDDLEWKYIPTPYIPLEIDRVRHISPYPSMTDVSNRIACLGNRTYNIGFVDEITTAVEEWLELYGYLKTLTIFKEA
jgi:hypothetical protein